MKWKICLEIIECSFIAVEKEAILIFKKITKYSGLTWLFSRNNRIQSFLNISCLSGSSNSVTFSQAAFDHYAQNSKEPQIQDKVANKIRQIGQILRPCISLRGVLPHRWPNSLLLLLLHSLLKCCTEKTPEIQILDTWPRRVL